MEFVSIRIVLEKVWKDMMRPARLYSASKVSIRIVLEKVWKAVKAEVRKECAKGFNPHRVGEGLESWDIADKAARLRWFQSASCWRRSGKIVK